MNYTNYCQFFKDIEANPHAPVALTQSLYLGAVAHVRLCDLCAERVGRVDALATKLAAEEKGNDHNG